MSRRKQSNPKPLKGGEEEEWAQSGTGEIKEKGEGTEGEMKDESDVKKKDVSEETVEEEKTVGSCEGKIRVVACLATEPTSPSEPARSPKRASPKESRASPKELPKEPLDYVSKLPPSLQNAIASGRFLCLPPGDVVRSKLPDADSRAGLGYLCTPCGIRFSSPSTLEAHQTYYCSHRHQKPVDPARISGGDSEGEDLQSGDSKSEETSKSEGSECVKALRTGKQYKCPHCSYSADKKVSLNRHMRMHSSSPVEEASASALVDRYCQDCDIRFSSLKTFRAHKTHYCGTRHGGKAKSPAGSPPPTRPLLVLPTSPVLVLPYSLVQAASLVSGPAGVAAPDTASVLLPDGSLQPLPLAFRPHLDPKLPYPAPEHPNKVAKPIPERKADGREITSPLDLSYRRSCDSDAADKEAPTGSPASADHEDIVCAPSIPLILSASSTCSSPSPSPASPALSSSSHSSKKIDCRKPRTESICNSPSPKSSAISLSPNSKSPRTTPNGVKNIKTEEKKKELPLKSDLSLQNLLLAAVAQGQMEGMKDYPRLPIPPELVPHLSAMCGRLPDAKSGPLGRPPSETFLPYLTPELALRMAELPPPPPPPVLLKQGESKCNECNIVFYRLENFVAHKMYYCTAGRTPEEPKPRSPPPSTPPKSPSPAPIPSTSKLPLYQFICAACGIKFTSYDNLTAHQTFYCPKRTNLDTEKARRCTKCKQMGGAEHQCGGSGWKCPCCPVTSATASQAQRHMDTHAGVKAFLCAICRYRGNTLRGMRTHIRMHFDKRPADINEENFISCIVEDSNRTEMEVDKKESSPPPRESVQVNGEGVKIKEEEEASPGEKQDSGEEVINVVDSDVTRVKSEPDVDESEDLSINNNNRRISPRYCKSCDISFNYLSTFIAHKKFYCPSHIYDSSSAEASRQTGTPVS